MIYMLLVVIVLIAVWGSEERYMEGVWDATHNPTIPPVKRALDQLTKRGWRP